MSTKFPEKMVVGWIHVDGIDRLKNKSVPFFILVILLANWVGMAFAQLNSGMEPSAKSEFDFPHPIVIAHRGASGYVPEHTLAAYSIAILQGADFIEPDVVITKDRQLIVRHDNVLNLTTDVADHPEFSNRRKTKKVDGDAFTGWFSEDFTLAEIKTLRAIERIPQLRSENEKFNGQFEILTLQEVIDFLKIMEEFTGRSIGIYPEIKHPTYFDHIQLSMEEPLVRILKENGYEAHKDRVYIQSFEVGNLKELNEMTVIPLVQLLGTWEQPYDVQAAGGTLTYAQMATFAGLSEISTYADVVAPEKYRFIIPKDRQNNLSPAQTTKFVQNAHSVGLKVHPYTFRAENYFLPTNFQRGQNSHSLGDSMAEMKAFFQTGIDGIFTDHPFIGVKARNTFIVPESE